MLGMRALAAKLGSLLKPSEDKQPQQRKEEMAPKQDDPAQSGEQKVDTRYNLKAPSLDAGGPCRSCWLVWARCQHANSARPACPLAQAPAWLWCPEQVLWWPASLWLKLLHVHNGTQVCCWCGLSTCMLRAAGESAGSLMNAMPPCLPAQASISAFSSCCTTADSHSSSSASSQLSIYSAQACQCLPAVALVIGAGHRFGAGVARQWSIEGAKAVIAPVYNEEERVRHCLTLTSMLRKQLYSCWMSLIQHRHTCFLKIRAP